MPKNSSKGASAPKKRRRKRTRVTPRLVRTVRDSIVRDQRVNYADLRKEHGLGMGTLARIVTQLEKQEVVGPGGKGKKRPVLLGADGAPKSAMKPTASPEGQQAAQKSRRKRRNRRQPGETAPASEQSGNGSVADEIALIREISSHFSPKKQSMLRSAAARLEKISRHSALLSHLSD